MDTSQIDQLEDRIRKAASLLRTLKEEKAAVENRLREREREIAELQATLARAPAEDLTGEVESLRSERKEILARVNKMLALLDEEAAPAQKSLLAAVDGNE